MRLPRPVNGISEVELKKPDTNTILSIYEKSEQGKIFSAMQTLLEGGIETLGDEKPTSSQIKQFPIVSAEVVATEIFKLYKIPTLVENVYRCPRCGSAVKHEQTPDSDTRDDISKLKINYSPDESNYVLSLDKENTVKIISNDKVVVEISSMHFRDPTLEDMIKIQSDATLKTAFRSLKKLYLSCLVDLDGDVADQDIAPECESLKNKYLYELLNFPDVRDFNRITALLRSFGYDPSVELSCDSCEKIWKGEVEWTGFFAYALRSTVKAEGK